MNREFFLTKASDEEVLEVVRNIRIGYRLKHTLRYNTHRDHERHSESVAEHVFALCLLAEFFLPLEDPGGLLDTRKIYQMLVFHDFGEIVEGDIPYHLKKKEDEVRERVSAQLVFESLPGHLSGVAHDAWKAYEERTTSEGAFVYALDKVEPAFELFDPVSERSMKRLQFSWDDHIHRKRRATEKFPVMRRFVEAISTDMLQRSVFWEK